MRPPIKFVLVVSQEMNGMDRKIDMPVKVIDQGWSTVDEAMTWAINNPSKVFNNGSTVAPVPMTRVRRRVFRSDPTNGHFPSRLNRWVFGRKEMR